MTTVTAARTALDAVSALGRAVDELLQAQWSGLDSGELLEAVRGLEVSRRRLSSVDHVVVAEIDDRSLAGAHSCRDTATLLVDVLRLDPREAGQRVRAAAEFAPRHTLTGEVQPPVFAQTARACAAGTISATHAAIVATTIGALPIGVQVEHDREFESFLVEQAEIFSPRELRIIARRLRERWDPEGRLSEDVDRERRRYLTICPRADGTVSGSFCTDAITGEALLTYLDATARPVKDESGACDPRNAGQRRHDALRDLVLAALRSGQVATCGGVTTTIIVAMTPDQLIGAPSSGHGVVATGHGALMSLVEARRLIGDAQLRPVLLGPGRRVRASGPSRRLFTEGQRLAMIARDLGCSFPGCSVGAQRCEAHHVIPFAQGGPTTIDNGTLLCSFHHRTFEDRDWECLMLDGVPSWRPPPWIDPTRTPRRNRTHLPDPQGA